MSSKTGYTVYNGCPVKCAKCGEETYRFTVLWANKHGTKIRVFCDSCRHATTYKNLYASDKPAQIVSQFSMEDWQ